MEWKTGLAGVNSPPHQSSDGGNSSVPPKTGQSEEPLPQNSIATIFLNFPRTFRLAGKALRANWSLLRTFTGCHGAKNQGGKSRRVVRLSRRRRKVRPT